MTDHLQVLMTKEFLQETEKGAAISGNLQTISTECKSKFL